jgi:acetylglutamate kinase
MINRRMEELGLETRFINGHRVTNTEHLAVVTQLLAGEVNKDWVAKMSAHQLPVIGLTGIDLQILRVKAKRPELGWVGEIVHVNQTALEGLIQQGWLPCLAPLGVDEKGQHYNINADDVAMAVAQSLQAERLILCSDVPGILYQGKILPQVDRKQLEELIAEQAITGGMVPKVRSGYRALQGAVQEVLITAGVQAHPLTGENTGTRIVK